MLAVACIASFSSCSSEEPSGSSSSAEATTQPTTASSDTPATKDSADSKQKKYDYLMIKQESEEISSQLDKIIADKKYYGTVYLKIGNDFEYIKSRGYANNEKHLKNSINTCSYVGSVTKQFTAAAVLKLCEQKKLSLTDTIDKFFPTFKDGKKITVKNLLTMTSGIQNYIERDNDADNCIAVKRELESEISKDNSKNENKKIIIDWILKQDLAFEPDSEFMFSDSNYCLLGEIIEKASGMSYEAYLEKNIFAPLSMRSTGFEPNDKTAVSYQGMTSDSAVLYSGAAYSSTGLISNVSDLLKWVDGLLDGSVLSKESLDIMFTAYKENYAMGLYVYGSSLCHSGKTDNYNAMLSFTRDKSEIFASLSNYGCSDSSYIFNLFKKSLKKYIAD